MSLRRFRDSVIILSIVLAAAPVTAQAPASARVAEIAAAGSSVDFRPLVDGDRYVLTVSTPDGAVVRREFAGGKTPSFAIGQRPDGVYNWELTVAPHVDKALRREIENARRADDRERAKELMTQGGFPKATLVQSGSFMVAGGQVVSSEGPEPRPRAAEKLVSITAEDQVIPDDLIVQGSACVGLDCVNNENFGFDTIRLKENNLRIHFDDTSTQVGFPANDWRIIANDSASGGSSKFSIEDSTGSKTPMTITAGAATNSIFVDSTGRLGLRTSTPVLDLHINTSNTPALRLEQNNSGGFTAQTWDIGANEANFFVRDVTGGSTLPFRIRPGAPTSSVDISADGEVGIGTASPTNKLHVKVGTAGQGILIDGDQTTDVSVNMTMQGDSAGFILNDLGGGVNQKVAQQFVNGNEWRIRGLNDAAAAETVAGVVFSLVNGNVGVNCTTAPGADLVVDDGGACNAGTRSELNAGATQFTVPSSRTLKENFAPVEVDGILEKIDQVKVYSYDFIDGPKDRIGLIAEDFHTVFGRGSDKKISGDEIQLAMWLAIQELSAQNAELRRELDGLKQRE